jgi:hypothetical protein
VQTLVQASTSKYYFGPHAEVLSKKCSDLEEASVSTLNGGSCSDQQQGRWLASTAKSI